ncbi:MAG: glutamate synthase subunit alpha, partial [Natronomonas sp.]
MSERTDHPGATEGLVDPTDYRANCGVGVVMDLDGDRSHETVSDGLELLENLEHRGTTGADEKTGDGAGILLQTPHEFFDDEIDDLPESGDYAVGSFFMPQNNQATAHLQDLTETILAEHGLDVFAWRNVPTDNETLGETAVESEPNVVQCFVRSDLNDDAFDHALYIARRDLENTVEERQPDGYARFYVCSIDRDTVVYKGLLTAEQLPSYYPELL